MAEQTFFFYDLETSGLSGRRDRVMQFAGQRTDMNLQPIGQPVNVLVELTDDVLPSPQAILITGKTPQMTVAEGISEVELARLLQTEIFTPGTIAVGFNNVRFDDEFVRHLLWRTFYDPYTWSWADGRSRWDMLDVVRMTRTLRPEGINWPVDDRGLPVNKLELLAQANGLDHTQAHDALSDIGATIAVAGLIKDKQPRMFEYLLKMRDKREVSALVRLADPQPFVYTSGRYGKERQFTTVALAVAEGSNQGEVIVFDATVSPRPFAELKPSQIHKALFDWQYEGQRLPFKRMKLNACPAVAPLAVLDVDDGWNRLQLDRQQIEAHIAELRSVPHLVDLVEEAFASRPEYVPGADPDEQLYAGFVNDRDKQLMMEVTRRDGTGLADWQPIFDDERLPELLLHYKARYYPESLNYDEQLKWGDYRRERLLAQVERFQVGLEQARGMAGGPQETEILDEVEEWARQVLPSGVLG